MEPQEGKTAGSSSPGTVSSKLQRVAKLAREHPDMVLQTLAHHIDVEFLVEAYRRTRKDGAPGVDGRTADEYELQLRENLAALLARFKSGLYRAPPVRRVHIPKGDGRTRPIGIPTFEDKILQRAVAMILEAVYEQDFLPCSYGFRPGRSAHHALDELRQGLWDRSGGWVLEVDIKSFFDTLDHRHLRAILDQRVRDRILRRAIHKWLHAGVQENGALSYPEAGTPQGGVISPILANIYLHYVLDTWFESDVKPRMKGRTFMVRYADDFVIVFDREDDARRVVEVLPKRFGKYGLTLHPQKTRLVPFERPRLGSTDGSRVGSFDFLGFTHHWARSRKDYWVVKRRTAKDRFTRAMKRINEWCRTNRHRPIAEQQQSLARKIRGHCQYYGLTGNSKRIGQFRDGVLCAWRKWLGRRSGRADKTWAKFKRLLERYPLPRSIAVHSALRRAASP